MRNFSVRILFLSLALLICSKAALGQSGKATAKIDSSSILIGDHVHLTLSYTFPSAASVRWPVFSDTLSKEIDIIEKGKFDTAYSADKSNKTLSQVLTVTCFDSGYFAIPSILFSHQMPGDTTRYISQTNTLMLMVNTVSVDTTKSIKDIKAPLSAPWSLMEILPWLAAGVLLAAIITFVVILIIRKKKKKPLFGRSDKPKIPPHLLALQELEKLRTGHLWQQGKIKEYHSRLTDILRVYISDRFGIDAMEMITPDLLDAMQNITGISSDNQEHLRRILQLADMVKFAKFLPFPDEHDGSLRYALQFVTDTSPLQEPSQEEGSGAPGAKASAGSTDIQKSNTIQA